MKSIASGQPKSSSLLEVLDHALPPRMAILGLFLLFFACVLFILSVVPKPVLSTPVCGKKQVTTRSVGGRSRTFPATHADCFGKPVGILDLSIPDFDIPMGGIL